MSTVQVFKSCSCSKKSKLIYGNCDNSSSSKANLESRGIDTIKFLIQYFEKISTCLLIIVLFLTSSKDLGISNGYFLLSHL